MNCPSLRICLLGGVRLECNGAAVTNLASRKAEAALIYLACNPRPIPRDSLAALFWPENEQSRALGNLSVALTSLRQQVGDYLIIDRRMVAFNPGDNCWLDAREFETAVRRARTLSQKSDRLGRTAAAQLTTAVSLYKGDFLAGFTIRNAPDFEAWALLEQERLRQTAVEALFDLVEFHLKRGRFSEGIACAQKLLGLDPLQEAAHRQLMRLYVAANQRAAALAQFERCVEILAAELGVEPYPETVALYEQIKAEASPALERHGVVAAARVPQHNLPVPPTSFVGREAELARIADWLADPNGRLLTIIGPGGVGKTRLAREAAGTHIADFADGVWFISLAPLTDAADLVSVMAGVTGFTFAGGEDMQNQLIDYLRPRETLLILDNFEHLLGETGLNLLADLLAQAPETRLLVTSRQRLHLQAEALLEIKGLPYPPARVGGKEEDNGLYPAVALFMERAQRLRPDLDLSGQETAVARLCRLVDGLPLALELAAAWTRALTLNDIMAEIERNIDFLETTLRDVPARHRSLRAVFEASWERLTPREKTVYRQLAPFRGGFTREAAQAASGASLSTLVGLADKCFLRLDEDGRYRRHPLLIQFAQAKLDQSPDERDQILETHSQYFIRFLEQRTNRLDARDLTVYAEIQADIENIRIAWRNAIDRRRTALIRQLAAPLALFYSVSGAYAEGIQTLQEAILPLSETMSQFDGDLTERRETLGRLLSRQGRMRLFLGRYPEARETLQAAYQVAQHLEDPQLSGEILCSLAAAFNWLGHYDEAARLLQDVCQLAEAANDVGRLLEAENGLGAMAVHRGRYREARRRFQRCYDLYRQNQFPEERLVGPLLNLGSVSVSSGDYAQANQYLAECLTLARKLNNRFIMALALNLLGKTCLDRGELAEAGRYQEESMMISRDLQNVALSASSLLALAQVALRQEEVAKAEKLALEGLALAQTSNSKPSLGYAYYVMAELRIAQREWAQATGHLQAALEMALNNDQLPVAMDALSLVGELALTIGERERAVFIWRVVLANEGTEASIREFASQRLRDLGEEIEIPPDGTAVWRETVAETLAWLGVIDWLKLPC